MAVLCRNKFEETRPGFHLVGWGEPILWHVLDERTIRVRDGKKTLCLLPLPDYHRHRVSLLSLSPYEVDRDRHASRRKFDCLVTGELRRPMCEECSTWVSYSADGGVWEMQGEMDEGMEMEE